LSCGPRHDVRMDEVGVGNLARYERERLNDSQVRSPPLSLVPAMFTRADSAVDTFQRRPSRSRRDMLVVDLGLARSANNGKT